MYHDMYKTTCLYFSILVNDPDIQKIDLGKSQIFVGFNLFSIADDKFRLNISTPCQVEAVIEIIKDRVQL